jgi:hypothetical protein
LKKIGFLPDKEIRIALEAAYSGEKILIRALPGKNAARCCFNELTTQESHLPGSCWVKGKPKRNRGGMNPPL